MDVIEFGNDYIRYKCPKCEIRVTDHRTKTDVGWEFSRSVDGLHLDLITIPAESYSEDGVLKFEIKNPEL